MLLLHISDIHFHTKEINRPYDPNLGLRDDMVHDIKIMRNNLGRPIDAILISGDVAFQGRKDEYDFAFEWLRDTLCPISGCDLENIFVIPGNHDVDRGATKAPVHEAARKYLRGVPLNQANAEITRYVDDPLSSKMLFDPIENYNRFAAKFLCEIGHYDQESGRKPYACRDFELNDGSTLRIWGFNSVLICDGDDDVNKMYVDPSAAQIGREDGVVHLVMCHHPFNWLRNATEFRGRIEEVSRIHLFGHEHSFRVDNHHDFTRVRAGALQPARDESGWCPGYNLIEVAVAQESGKRFFDLTIWVRHWQDNRFIPVPDRKSKDPWYIRHEIESWTSPQPVLVSSAAVTSAPVIDMMTEIPKIDAAPLSIRTVALKILDLREYDQRKIITELNLHKDGDQKLLDFEFALAAVRRADERGELKRLNDAIDSYIEGD